MSYFKVLGSCAGTEPMPDRHHTSVVLNANGRNYFFDAGENCSHTAHTQGIDLTATRAVFISHTHYDHIGGLMGLFWTIRKLCTRYNINLADGEIKLFIPETSVWDHIYEVLKSTEGKFSHSFGISVNTPDTETFYKDDNIEVTAFESHHLPLTKDGCIQSFSYKINIGEKTVVFSGDIKDMNDLTDAVGDGCDILFCETGHHEVKTVCEFAYAHNVKKLVLIHHGREILENQPSAKEAIKKSRVPLVIAEDGTVIEI